MPGDPATSPYNPNRTDPPSVFKDMASRTARWGDLPPKVRDAVMKDRNGIDDFPPEWREKIKQYYKSFEDLNKK